MSTTNIDIKKDQGLNEDILNKEDLIGPFETIDELIESLEE